MATCNTDSIESGAPFTCRITAAFRSLEMVAGSDAIINDPLAPYLAGNKATEIAKRDLEQLINGQGPGRHLRIPARNRIIDDQLLEVLSAIGLSSSHEGPVQVVNLGSGMVRECQISDAFYLVLLVCCSGDAECCCLLHHTPTVWPQCGNVG